MSRMKLAPEMGLYKSELEWFERGDEGETIPLLKLIRAARALGVTLEDLFIIAADEFGLAQAGLEQDESAWAHQRLATRVEKSKQVNTDVTNADIEPSMNYAQYLQMTDSEKTTYYKEREAIIKPLPTISRSEHEAMERASKPIKTGDDNG